MGDRACAGRLSGRSVAVTGSSSGIGRAVALRLAAEGASVVCGDLEPESPRGGAPTHELAAAAGGGGARFVRCDVRRASDSEALVAAAAEATGRVDVVVANAGIGGRRAPLHELGEDDWDAVLDVNLRGAFLTLRAAVRRMLSQDALDEVRGRIVATASQHGMVGPPGHPAYAASKGGLINLVRQAAVDYGPQGILVNAVAPAKILVRPVEEEPEEWLAYTRSRTPFPRLGRPEDVASAVLYLAADATYTSGISLLVDGGWMAY